jgi:hypothetical protein
MASAVDTQKLKSRLQVKSYDHDPGATTAVVVSPDGGTTKRVADLSLFSRFMVQAKPTIVGGGGLTKLEIIASAATDMSSPTVIKDSGTVAADALDDNVTLECSAEEVRHLGADLRYVAGRLTMATATDEASVVYILAGGRFSYQDLTADSVIA